MCVSVPKECVCSNPTRGLQGGEISCTHLGCSHPTGGLQGEISSTHLDCSNPTGGLQRGEISCTHLGCSHPTGGLQGEISCTHLGCSHPTGGLQGGEIRNCFSKGGGWRKPSSGSDGANTLIKQILENS